MEDCCVVCAEPLEWVAYGPCGHREVCFTCVARLRVVLEDQHCCICKQHCPIVYVTKALGDYTKVVTDWKPLLDHSQSSRQGSFWYDNVVEASFDDEEPFKIIKTVCRLSCSICERGVEGESIAKGMVKKGYIFKNIDSLRRHESIVHNVVMCGLCLQGRKVFVSEQKLYTKSQLHQHLRKGNLEVDGDESFAGHPMCQFCRKRFYGDNELYQHMSQDHYTCHICQRARPGHFEYYHTYDDLEAHFRHKHALCENPECLARKFVVFPSEAELKRHNASLHGGHMTRSQRNAALQIPVPFEYRRPGQDFSSGYNGGDYSRRGGRGRLDARNEQLGAAAPANIESTDFESLNISHNNTNQVGVMDIRGAVEREVTANLEEGVAQIQDPVEVRPSRYLAALGGGGGTPSAGGDAAFPPLPGTPPSAFPPLPGTSQSGRVQARAENRGPASIMAALVNGNRSGRGGRAGIRVLNKANLRSSPVPAR
ncbi:unnamed protein product [Calypogeia fissa]